MSDLASLVHTLPEVPGVYMWKDGAGTIIYVGKAKSLKKRVSSYLRKTGLDRKTWELMQRAADLETIITNTEREALLLEMTLIRKHLPKYNLALKDDRRHAWIRIDMNQEIPVAEVTRDVAKDNARYFGPYGSTKRLERFLETARKFLPVAMCTGPESARRECMDYHLNRCVGPCKDHVTKEEYRSLIEQLCLFLDGNETRLGEVIREQMEAASHALQFERAAQLRDRLEDLEIIMRRQRVIETDGRNTDVLGIARTEQAALVEMLVIRGGMLIGSDHFFFEVGLDTGDEEILTTFIEQFYFNLPRLPDEVLVPIGLETMEQLGVWLEDTQNHSVRIHLPAAGRESDLVEMARANADRSLRKILILGESEDEIVDEGVKELKVALGLQRAPLHIECFDIANIQGTDPTGACVVFRNGQSDNKSYRMFRVRVKESPDDYAMMHEVVFRRYKGVLDRGESLPDLVLVDGGKGQLSVAMRAMSELGLDYIPVAALAKKEEVLFAKDITDGVALDMDSDGIHLVQRIRDEAHRFAQRYHHKLREKRFTGSILEEAPGIGPKRRKALIDAFGSFDGVRAASAEELARVDGMTGKVADGLKAWLERQEVPPPDGEATES